jgi:outer membrane protein
VSGNSKGSELQLGIEHSFNFERKFQVTPHASMIRQDAKLVDYYYGVRASEATAARPEYKGKSTTETQFGVRFGYLMTPNQKFILDVSDAHFGSGITNSPIVDKKTTPAFQLGYLYSF